MLEVRRIDPLSETGEILFGKVRGEQIARYGRDGGRTLEELADPDIIFVAAFLDGEPVGCGAVVPLGDGAGELSRIFVDEQARRKGVATAVMNALETQARGAYRRLVLETGILQAESIALYERLGYSSMPCWGESATNPRSRCYEKFLA